ncbi:hypothetical protein AgCh_035344 [Apium graveolens]
MILNKNVYLHFLQSQTASPAVGHWISLLLKACDAADTEAGRGQLDEHRLLVYEFIARGNLDNQLFSKYSVSLPWLTRLKIAVDAAKGLAFHHYKEPPIIYHDFKASNILLGSDYSTKVVDFGLAVDGPQGVDAHVTTSVMGTESYAAPEYLMTATTEYESVGEVITGIRQIIIYENLVSAYVTAFVIVYSWRIIVVSGVAFLLRGVVARVQYEAAWS